MELNKNDNSKIFVLVLRVFVEGNFSNMDIDIFFIFYYFEWILVSG